MGKLRILVICIAIFACLAQVSSAHGLRHDAQHRAKLAHALARQEMMQRAQVRSSVLQNATHASRVGELRGAVGLVLRSFVNGTIDFLKSIGSTTHGVSTPESDSDMKIETAEAAEEFVEATLGTKQVCVLGVCGYNLVFVSIWVLFGTAFAAIYALEKSRKPNSPSKDEMQSHAFTEPSTYFQDVTGMASTATLRRRPGKIVQ